MCSSLSHQKHKVNIIYKEKKKRKKLYAYRVSFLLLKQKLIKFAKNKKTNLFLWLFISIFITKTIKLRTMSNHFK